MKQPIVYLSFSMLVLLAGVGIYLSPNQTHASLLDCSTAVNINVPTGECEALLDLYDSTDGAMSWNNTSGWDTDSNVCDWYGIDCTNILGQDRVTSIILSINNLNGILPASLSGLTEIQTFYVDNNQISGELPTERSTWTNISSFWVHNNQISGELPTERSTWTNVYTFDVSDNDITGVLPTERDTWESINDFHVTNNQISGELPTERSIWNSITYFEVGGNEIGGELPTERSGWTNIDTFNIEYNQFSGELPTERSAWTGISRFDISNNYTISGELPVERSAWTNIDSFGVGYNQISGELPTERSTWTNIDGFDVKFNQINGTLPSERSGWTAIDTFTIESNQISGELPSERSTWTNISSFGVGTNQISGELPSERSTWTGISSIGLGSNQIGGELPVERSTWTNIWYVDLSDNQISGELPVERSGWIDISYFYVNDNQISGELPVERSGWIDISHFYVNDNQITGEPPMDRGQRQNIIVFDMSYNNLYGYVPDSWAANRPAEPGQTFNFTYNCLETTGYIQNTEDRFNNSYVYLTPQADCSPSTTADLSVTKTSQATTGTDDDTITYTIEYVNNGPDTAENVVLEDIPGLGLVLDSVSTGYSTGQVGTVEYGVVGDVCYDSLAADTTGPYVDALSQSVGQDFQVFLTANVGYTGGANRGQWWIDIAETYFAQGSFQANMILFNSVDITTVDSSCGTPVEDVIQIDLGDFPSGATGSVTMIFQVSGAVLAQDQITLTNTVTISSDTQDDDLDNNESIVIIGYEDPVLPTADLSVTKTSTTTTGTDDDTITYTIEYANSGPDTAVNTLLSDLPGTGLTLESVSTGYIMTGGTSPEYAVPGDVCYDDLYDNNTGSYADALNQWAIVAGQDIFETEVADFPELLAIFLQNAVDAEEMTTEQRDYFLAHPGLFFVEAIAPQQGGVANWFAINMELDISDIDPSCGTPASAGYIQIDLGNLASGATGSVTVVFQVDGDAIGSGQTTLVNMTSIASDTAEENEEDNEDAYELLYETSEGEGEPDPEPEPEPEFEEPEEPTRGDTGGPRKDNCPDGDYSPSYYDGICGSKPVIEPHPVSPISTNTPVDTTSDTISQICKYTDENFKHYMFTDIVGTRYVSAVDTMLYHCLVHGYNNNGVSFGPNNGLKLGELYKVFTRMSLLDFNLNHPGQGWSHGYYLAGEKAGLWEGIDTTRSQETIVTSAELLQVTQNFLAYKGKATNTIQLPASMTNRSVYRGEFVNFITMVLGSIY